MKDEVTRIKIGKQARGVIGLKQTLEAMSETHADASDEDARVELLGRLSQKNYIPETVKDLYGDAFLKSFRQFMGKPVADDAADDAADGMAVKILGQGCVRCDQLEQDVIEVLADLKSDADVEHVRDVKEIGRYGVMGTPALVINGEVKWVGSVPSKAQLRGWLSDVPEAK